MNNKNNFMYSVDSLALLWDEYAKIYERLLAAPVFKKLAKDLFESVIPVPDCIVHDGGCGIGYHLQTILQKTQARKIIATDFSQEMLNKAAKRIVTLPRADQIKIELLRLDLAREWPKEKFDIQIFQLVPNYLPDNGWKRIIKSGYETLTDGGYLYTSTMLYGMNVRELSRGHLLNELFHTPFNSFPAMYKSSKVMGNFDRLSAEGKILLPTKGEYLDFHKSVGFEKIDLIGEIFWGAGIIVRAQK